MLVLLEEKNVQDEERIPVLKGTLCLLIKYAHLK